MKHIVLFLLVSIFIGCSKDTAFYEESDCLNKLLIEHKMTPYTGNENYCHSLQMVQCENDSYYFLDCCICDMIFNPFDCNNKSLLIDEKTGLHSPEKQKLFDAKFKNCKEAVVVGVL
jgi:hypothetical protein